jgi:beta-1,4-mannosyltransferase
VSEAPILEAVRALRFLAGTGARDPVLVLAVPAWPGDTFAERLLAEGWEVGVGVIPVDDPGAAATVAEAVARHGATAAHLGGLAWVTAAATSADDAGLRADRVIAALDRLDAAACPVLWSVRGSDHAAVLFPEAADRVRRAVAGRSALVHVPSAAAKDHVLAGLDVPSERVVAVPHPVSAAALATHGSRAGSRFSLGLQSDEVVFLALGSPLDAAATTLLLDAWRGTGRVADARLLVVTSPGAPGPDADRLSAALDTAPDVTVIAGPPTFERLAQLCRAADVVVLPERDPFDQDEVLLALDHGLPVIAPVVAPELELLDDRVACLFDPGDAAGLADALRRAPSLIGPAAVAAGHEIAAGHEPGAVSRAFVSELRRRLAGA